MSNTVKRRLGDEEVMRVNVRYVDLKEDHKRLQNIVTFWEDKEEELVEEIEHLQFQVATKGKLLEREERRQEGKADLERKGWEDKLQSLLRDREQGAMHGEEVRTRILAKLHSLEGLLREEIAEAKRAKDEHTEKASLFQLELREEEAKLRNLERAEFLRKIQRVQEEKLDLHTMNLKLLSLLLQKFEPSRTNPVVLK